MNDTFETTELRSIAPALIDGQPKGMDVGAEPESFQAFSLVRLRTGEFDNTMQI